VRVSAFIFAHVLYAGQKLPDFKMDIAGSLLFFSVLMVVPLGFFTVQLNQAGRTAKREFGALASRMWTTSGRSGYRAGFAVKSPCWVRRIFSLWLTSGILTPQSKDTRLLPMSKRDLFRLMGIIVLPFLPLVLTMFSVDEVIKRLFKLVF
jgi:hypothetical protein